MRPVSRAQKVLAILIAVIITGSGGYILGANANVTPSSPIIQSKWSFVGSCSYHLFTDGAYTYGQSCVDNTIQFGGPKSAGGISGSNAAAVMQAAMNAVSSCNNTPCSPATVGGVLYVETGNYTISTSLVPKTDLDVECGDNTFFLSNAVTVIEAASSAAAIANFIWNGCSIQNTGTGGTAIDLGYSRQGTFANFYIYGNWNYGVKINQLASPCAASSYNTFQNVKIYRMTLGGTAGFDLVNGGGCSGDYSFNDVFTNDRVDFYTAGYAVYADRETFIECVAGSDTTGWAVTGHYGNTWINPQIEGTATMQMTTGFSFTGAALSDTLIGWENGGYVTTSISDISDFALVSWETGSPYKMELSAPGGISLNGNPITSIGGISEVPTLAANLAGQITISGTSTWGSVSFGTAEANIDYYAFCTVNGYSESPATGAYSCSTANPQTTGFIINLQAAPGGSTSVTVAWFIIQWG